MGVLGRCAEGRQQAGFGQAGLGQRLAQAGVGGLDAGGVGQRAGDQRVQLRIAQRLPPTGIRPGGGGDIDPRWRGIVATIRCDFVSRSYRRSFELSELVREAFLTAEARNEHTPDGYFAHFRIYVPPNRIQIPRSPEDEWRFTALYGVVIS